MTNTPEMNGNVSDARTVQELVLHPGRLTYGKVSGNKILSRLGVSCDFAELSYCCIEFSCIYGEARGTMHVTFGRVRQRHSICGHRDYFSCVKASFGCVWETCVLLSDNNDIF